MKTIQNLNILLASKSPRRQRLLKDMGLKFRIVLQDIEEVYPSSLATIEIPSYLAHLKAKAVQHELKSNKDVILASDTIVALEQTIFGKPTDADEAKSILRQLSGKKHQVISGVCLLQKNNCVQFSTITDVYFMELSDAEIDFYIEQYQPFDKAGAYAIQEWIGLNKIEKVDGSFFNVVGLPTQAVYQALENLAKKI